MTFPKKTLSLLILLAMFGGIYSQWIHRTKGFCLKKILSSHPYEAQWDISSPLSEEIQTILQKPFFYLGSGKQTYAFVSEDGKHVLKFFKQKHMRNTHFSDPFPVPKKYKKKVQKKKKARAELRKQVFTSYLIAYQDLSDLTGVEYLHLTKTPLGIQATFYDPHHRKFTLSLDRQEFLIQKKAEPAFQKLNAFLENGEQKKASLAINSMIALIKKRRDRNIVDDDLNTKRNLGLIGTQAIEIDIGEFFYGTNRSFHEEITSAFEDLFQYMHTYHPFFVTTIEKLIQHAEIQDALESQSLPLSAPDSST